MDIKVCWEEYGQIYKSLFEKYFLKNISKNCDGAIYVILHL